MIVNYIIFVVKIYKYIYKKENNAYNSTEDVFVNIHNLGGVEILWTVSDGITILREHGAKITAQRIAILRNLEGRTDHPSADMIYKDLAPEYPTMSVATVYSTAQLLADAGLVKIISIDDKRVYLDPNTSTHGHFQCKQCGMVLDFSVNEKKLLSAAISTEEIAHIDSTEVFFYGVCSNCVERH